MFKFYKKKSNNPTMKPKLVLAKTFTQTVEFDSNSEKTVQHSIDRFPEILTQNANHQSVIMGSTFSATFGTPHKSQILDSCYSGYIYDEGQDRVTGMIIAIADGFGGHFDPEEDRHIAKAAKTAVTFAANEMAKYKRPNDLLFALYEIAAKTGEMVNLKSKGSSTTLACGRVFEIMPGQYEFVGFNVGDCMIACWDPNTKQCTTLLAGINDGMCPAPINGFSRDQLDIIKISLGENTILMAMSDGVYGMLTPEPTMFKDTKGVSWYKYELDEKIMDNFLSNEIFSAEKSTKDFAQFLLKKVTEKIESIRPSFSSVKESIGDDTSLIVSRISQKAFKNAYTIKKSLDSLLPNAMNCITKYKKTKDLNFYNRAKHAFIEAHSLYNINDDHIGKIYCLLGTSLLSNTMFNIRKNQPTFYDIDTYQQKCITHALDLINELHNLTAEVLEQFVTKKKFISEIRNFLNTTQKLISSIEKKKNAAFEDSKKKIEAGLEILLKLEKESALAMISGCITKP